MNTILVETICPMCGENHYVEVFEDDYDLWQNGMLAQDAFPYLSAEAREMLISGLCPDCWAEMFGEEE